MLDSSIAHPLSLSIDMNNMRQQRQIFGLLNSDLWCNHTKDKVRCYTHHALSNEIFSTHAHILRSCLWRVFPFALSLGSQWSPGLFAPCIYLFYYIFFPFVWSFLMAERHWLCVSVLIFISLYYTCSAWPLFGVFVTERAKMKWEQEKQWENAKNFDINTMELISKYNNEMFW